MFHYSVRQIINIKDAIEPPYRTPESKHVKKYIQIQAFHTTLCHPSNEAPLDFKQRGKTNVYQQELGCIPTRIGSNTLKTHRYLP